MRCGGIAENAEARDQIILDYIASWLEVLREDDRAVVRAAFQASKAADWLRGFMPDYDRLPAEAGDEREAA